MVNSDSCRGFNSKKLVYSNSDIMDLILRSLSGVFVSWPQDIHCSGGGDHYVWCLGLCVTADLIGLECEDAHVLC